MRLAVLADQHGHLPAIPPCDLLIIAGDLCPDAEPHRQAAWLQESFIPWLAASGAPRTVATWGNHDFCGEADPRLTGSSVYGHAGRLDLVVDEAIAVDGISIWATPWANAFGQWAFMKAPGLLAPVYSEIPSGVDILVSHQPPYGYGDEQFAAEYGGIHKLGSRELLAAIERVWPRLVVCGHIHAGYGRYEHRGIPIFNVSVVNEDYEMVHPVTIIDWPLRADSPRD